MSLPNGTRPHDGEIPSDNEAIGVSGQQALVGSEEGDSMDLGLVASEDGLGLRRGAVVTRVVRSGHGGNWRRCQWTEFTKSPWIECEAQTGALGDGEKYQSDQTKNAISLGLGLRMREMACSVIGLSGFCFFTLVHLVSMKSC